MDVQFVGKPKPILIIGMGMIEVGDGHSYHDSSPRKSDECQEWTGTNFSASNSCRGLENDIRSKEDQSDDVLNSQR